MEIVTLTGLNFPTVRKAIDLFIQGSWPAIQPAAWGRNTGDGRRLSAEQEAVVRRVAVGPHLLHWCNRKEERPLPQRRQFGTLFVEASAVHGCGKRLRSSGRKPVMYRFAVAEPLAQLIEIDGFSRRGMRP